MKNIENYPTYVINLKRRPERLKQAVSEMSYMGWNYRVFEAVDTNSHTGCMLSHKEIAKRLLENNEEYIVTFEDDLFFMPYAREFLPALNKQINSMSCNIINLGPAFHRPVSKIEDKLINLSELPPRNLDRHRGIYGTVGLIYNRLVAEKIIKYYEDPNPNHAQVPIDVFLDEFIYPLGKAYSPITPLITQRPVYSDINYTNDNNHYVITYNWNLYSPYKLPGHFLDFGVCENLKK
jgi:GR25 family glycosyltransferase involved in LPS biosynthesis